jgi:hypothetical protein
MKFLISLKNSSAFSFNKYSSYLFAIATFAFAFYLQYSVAFLGLDLHHDLLMFDAARNFYSGQIPYKDFFYQYNLATLFLHSAALGLFGLKIISLKKITILFYASIALLIYLSCAIEGNKRAGFFLSILWSLLSPFYMPAMNGYHAWSTVYMMFSCMAGLVCLQQAIRKNPFIFSIVAGVFFGLAFWFKQVAAYQIIAVIFWLILSIWISFKDRSDRLMYTKIFYGYAFGGLIISAIFIGYLYSQSAMLNWWTDAFEFNRYFAGDSQNSSGINAYLKLFFPISLDMGYRSFIWALTPLVLCSVALYILFYRNKSIGGNKFQKESLVLFVLTGFAGWAEYFPLPHPFHTQIFMAPIFIVVGVFFGSFSIRLLKEKKQLSIAFAICIFIGFASYEGIRHLSGLMKKKEEYRKGSVSANINSPFDGLMIDKLAFVNLVNFYDALIKLRGSNQSSEFIPFSVDPLRGLLPDVVNIPSDFKMGVNWTWPNELVEPNFAQKIYKQVLLNQQPIYADSIIYVPGYRLVSILEMQSPITMVHTIYEPSKVVSTLNKIALQDDKILYANKSDFDLHSRSIIFDWNSKLGARNLIPFDVLSDGEIKNLKNIHVAQMNEKDIPIYLSDLQMDYLKKVENFYGLNLESLFTKNKPQGWIRRKNIKHDDQKALALFMLSTGKFFKEQNKPTYTSTLVKSRIDPPTLVGLGNGDQRLHLLWSSNIGATSKLNYSYGNTFVKTYLAVKPFFVKNEPSFMFVQIEFLDGGLKNYFFYS